MKTSRIKKNESDHLASQITTMVLIKKNRKIVLFLLIVVLIFFASFLLGCKSRPLVTPDSAKEQVTLLIDEIRVTPKDFLFGLNENHPIVREVNNMTDDVLKGNRMTVRAPVEENGTVIEKEFIFTTPSRIKEKDSHLDYAGKSWLWDSCFHAMILSETEPEVAKKELLAVVSHQRKDGFIPHMNYWAGDGHDPTQVGGRKRSQKVLEQII